MEMNLAEVKKWMAITEGHRDLVEWFVAEVERLKDWKDSVLNALMGTPEFNGMEWSGDKEEWGFCFELIRHLSREKNSAEAERDRYKAALEEVSTHLGAVEDIIKYAIEIKPAHCLLTSDYELWLQHELKAHGEYSAKINEALAGTKEA